MIYVISDIHGQYELFLKMLKKIKFTDNDTLYVLGDIIDRGPSGIACLLDIMKRSNVKMLLGNHEYMMLNAVNEAENSKQKTHCSYECLNLWKRNGCSPTIADYNKLSEIEQKDIIACCLI